MKTCLMLLSSAVLALPMFAQQSNSSATAQPSSANLSSDGSTATGQPPLRNEPPHDFWDGDEPSLSALIFHPYASKGYVRRHVQVVQDRVNELDGLTASNSKMIKDVDDRAQGGIQLASTKASMADQHAMDATSKAQSANQSATALNGSLSSAESQVGNLDQYNSAAQTEIRFHPGQTALSKKAKEALDQIAAQLKNQHGYIIEVQGFSAGRGQTAIANSRNMAAAVERYLVLNQEIPAYRIYTIGMGNAAASQRSGGTRVEVSVLKNGLEQAAK